MPASFLTFTGNIFKFGTEISLSDMFVWIQENFQYSNINALGKKNNQLQQLSTLKIPFDKYPYLYAHFQKYVISQLWKQALIYADDDGDFSLGQTILSHIYSQRSNHQFEWNLDTERLQMAEFNVLLQLNNKYETQTWELVDLYCQRYNKIPETLIMSYCQKEYADKEVYWHIVCNIVDLLEKQTELLKTISIEFLNAICNVLKKCRHQNKKKSVVILLFRIYCELDSTIEKTNKADELDLYYYGGNYFQKQQTSFIESCCDFVPDLKPIFIIVACCTGEVAFELMGCLYEEYEALDWLGEVFLEPDMSRFVDFEDMASVIFPDCLRRNMREKIVSVIKSKEQESETDCSIDDFRELLAFQAGWEKLDKEGWKKEIENDTRWKNVWPIEKLQFCYREVVENQEADGHNFFESGGLEEEDIYDDFVEEVLLKENDYQQGYEEYVDENNRNDLVGAIERELEWGKFDSNDFLQQMELDKKWKETWHIAKLRGCLHKLDGPQKTTLKKRGKIISRILNCQQL